MDVLTLPQTRDSELMDDPNLAESEHVAALEALERINTVSRTGAQLARALGGCLSAAATAGTEPMVVVDIACGGGDVTMDLAVRLGRLAGRFGRRSLKVVGIDISPRAIQRCRESAARRGIDAEFIVHDATTDGCPSCDFAVSSLFLHHLDDRQAGDLMRRMADAARVGVVISDLVRSRTGLALAVVATTLLCSSRVARVDGPRSVRAARTPGEYEDLCRSAGFDGAAIRRVWPERVMISWTKTADCPVESPKEAFA